jgi:hypothetical protein
MFTTTKMTLADYMAKSQANKKTGGKKGTLRKQIQKGTLEKARTNHAIHGSDKAIDKIKITKVMMINEETAEMGLSFILAKDQRIFLKKIKPKKARQMAWTQVAYINKCIREYNKLYNNILN